MFIYYPANLPIRSGRLVMHICNYVGSREFYISLRRHVFAKIDNTCALLHGWLPYLHKNKTVLHQNSIVVEQFLTGITWEIFSVCLRK